MASIGSCWCYRCNRFIRVRVRSEDAVHCPDCGGGFVEELETPSRSPLHPRFPAAVYLQNSPSSDNATPAATAPSLRRTRRIGGDRSPFNPVIVLPGSADEAIGAERGNYELYYDDGAGLGLRPLPASVSEFLMGSGFDRLLEQLAQLEANGLGRFEHPPASKAAIESMPAIKIVGSHVVSESHCAVCKEAFELGSEAREMPCKHIFHSDCILPWLSIRNSCPVCRHELPTEARNSPQNNGVQGEASMGLTIWRLPGGGFAVGRFTGGRRAAEGELPVVFTEMDGGFSSGGAPMRIPWAASGRRSRQSSGLGSMFRNFFSFFGRLRSSSSRESSESRFSRRSLSSTMFSRSSRRRSQPWTLDDSRR